MLTFKNLTLAYGPKILIEKANLQLYKGQVYGLVGPNGAGKSTIFKLILRQIQAEQGDCIYSNNLLINHIEQEISELNQPLLEYVLFSHYLYKANASDLPEYYQLQPSAQKLLHHLGFKAQELNNPLNTFSGGWQMRANLAKALFAPSDLLLLDEPTNHLDIETVLWLEKWLNRYQGLAIIISHDREFLDRVTSSTLNIAQRQLTLYGGNYTTFRKTRAEQELQQQKNTARVQAQIAHLQSFVARFRAKASKASQAQSRMKMIEKLQLAPSMVNDCNYSINFLTPEMQLDKLLSIKDAVIGYSAKVLIHQVNLQVFAGARIGLLGKNGRGKTSLIKAILDQSSLLNGSIDLHPKLKIAYFAQQTVAMLKPEDTPLNIISAANANFTRQEALNYLGAYGFSASVATATITNFSGGEKARLMLAAIILTKPNILFLDEPTNHLDINMREELACSLQEYCGAVILVSHDKFLLQSVVDDYYLIENQRLTPFNGSLDDYHQYLLEQEEESRIKKTSTAQVTAKSKPQSINKSSSIIAQNEKELQQQTAKIAQLEQQVAQANQAGTVAELAKLYQQLEQAQTQLQQLEELWLQLNA
jgi:ATP-binding cassette subfamily F protein 3